MKITNVTEYDNMTNDYYNNICTTNDYNFDQIIPSLLLTVPYCLSFLCLLSLMIYTLVKPLINNK